MTTEYDGYFMRDPSAPTGARPAKREEWLNARVLDDEAAKRVAKDAVGDAEISTVFLGINHQYGDGPPVLWETMIFGGSHDQDQWRYISEQDARVGHERVVVALREGRDPNE